MVSATPSIPRQELRDMDGRTFAFIVSAEELQRLLVESEGLRMRVAELEAQADQLRSDRDTFERQMHELLPVATPEEEAEMQRSLSSAVPLDLSAIIKELEAGGDT